MTPTYREGKWFDHTCPGAEQSREHVPVDPGSAPPSCNTDQGFNINQGFGSIIFYSADSDLFGIDTTLLKLGFRY